MSRGIMAIKRDIRTKEYHLNHNRHVLSFLGKKIDETHALSSDGEIGPVHCYLKEARAEVEAKITNLISDLELLREERLAVFNANYDKRRYKQRHGTLKGYVQTV